MEGCNIMEQFSTCMPPVHGQFCLCHAAFGVKSSSLCVCQYGWQQSMLSGWTTCRRRNANAVPKNRIMGARVWGPNVGGVAARRADENVLRTDFLIDFADNAAVPGASGTQKNSKTVV